MGRWMEVMLRDRGFTDFSPLFCGVEQWLPGAAFGPTVRSYYLLHYVVSGTGTLVKEGTTYPLTAGQYFMIQPGETNVYSASVANPFKCVWIAFNGKCAERFATIPTVGWVDGAVFTELENMIIENFPGWGGLLEEYVITVLHRFSALLFAERSTNQHYASRVATYIRASYMTDVSVQKIADNLALTRRHLSRLFKQRYGVTIQEYLLTVRLENAARLLREGHSVAESADMCGYSDRSNFSRMFHRRYGVWPTDYRRYLEEKTESEKDTVP